MNSKIETQIQAKVFDFALADLVLQHRDSFKPVWTLESWAKLLIWMALNCGLSGDQESLKLFAEALGPRLTARMRRLFFERSLEDLQLKLMADPADSSVLVMPISESFSVSFDMAADALNKVGLLERVAPDRNRWQLLDAVIAIPWHSSQSSS